MVGKVHLDDDPVESSQFRRQQVRASSLGRSLALACRSVEYRGRLGKGRFHRATRLRHSRSRSQRQRPPVRTKPRRRLGQPDRSDPQCLRCRLRISTRGGNHLGDSLELLFSRAASSADSNACSAVSGDSRSVCLDPTTFAHAFSQPTTVGCFGISKARSKTTSKMNRLEGMKCGLQRSECRHRMQESSAPALPARYSASSVFPARRANSPDLGPLEVLPNRIPSLKVFQSRAGVVDDELVIRCEEAFAQQTLGRRDAGRSFGGSKNAFRLCQQPARI